jgi:hypothetical protein
MDHIKIIFDLIDEKNQQLNSYIKKENFNKFFADNLKTEINRLNFIYDYLLNSEKNKIDKTDKQLNDLNRLIQINKKFELICLIHGIDNINYFLNYSIDDLIDMLKDFRNNNMIRIPICMPLNKKVYKSEICKITGKYILKKS